MILYEWTGTRDLVATYLQENWEILDEIKEKII